MATVKQLVAEFVEKERSIGRILDESAIAAQCMAAVRFYAGYALKEPASAYTDVAKFEELTQETELTPSEWALIRPLFLLYVERETALQLEASRVMGADPWGRNSSEVGAEITQYEMQFPQKAFAQPLFTV